MKQKKALQKITISISIIFGLAFCLSQAKAASTPLPAPNNAITVATVNIYDAKIVSQEKNKLKITFDLSNREMVQPDVHYAVQLMQKDVDTLSVIDEKIYPETINLGENETLKKEIEYLSPQYLNGKFRLWLVAKNASGMTLSNVSLGEITLAGDNQYVGVAISTCYLKVMGELGDKKYNLKQGVDISSEEKLIATCDATNYSDTTLTLTPQVKTYWRSTFGKLVEDNKESQTALTFEAKKQKTISIVLPKANLPQAYDAVLVLVNNQKEVLSTSVAFHYVLQGSSATIQSFIMDKSAYQKGETAKASFFWTPSAGIFPDSRVGLYIEKMALSMQVEIRNSKGVNCISPTNEILDATKNALNFSYPIIAECSNPKITISIKDAKGNILDKKEYSLEAQASKAVAEKPGTTKTEKSLLTYAIILVAVLLIISFGLIYFKKNGDGGGNMTKLTIFLILLAGGLFFSADEVKADMWTAYIAGTTKGSGEPTDIPINFDVSLNKLVYAPNEDIKVTGTAMSFVCSNSSSVNIELTGETNGSEKTLIPRSMYGYSGTVYINGGDPVIFKAPSVPGTYKMHYAGEVGYYSTPTSYDASYTVAGCSGVSPSNADLCVGDDTDLTSSVTKTLVTACSSPTGSTPKCEYTCKTGFALSGGICVANTYSCTNIPTDADLCTDDATGLTANVLSALVTTCSSPVGSLPKCQYTCKAGFTLSGGTCVATTYPCSGTAPVSPQIACPGTQTTGLASVTLWTDKGTLAACAPSAGKCEYYTPTTYPCSGTAPVSPQIACPGTQTSGLSVAKSWDNRVTLSNCTPSGGICEYYVQSCNYSCDTCTKTCGGGTQNCTLADCSHSVLDCNTQPCSSGLWHEVAP